MAICPNTKCRKAIQWDWDQDVYRYAKTGQVLGFVKNTIGSIEIKMTQCSCGCVISFAVPDDEGNGLDIFDHPNFDGLDWEYKHHCYSNARTTSPASEPTTAPDGEGTGVSICPHCNQKTFNNPCGHCNRRW